MNVHNLGDLLPVEATASGSLFVKTQIEFVGLTKPTFDIVEMPPVHAHSDNSHTTVARDFFNIGYYTHVTERVSSAFCGDMTDQSRWILFGHKFPGPPFDTLAYCNKSYPVGVGALDDIGDMCHLLCGNRANNSNFECEARMIIRGAMNTPTILIFPRSLSLARCSLATSMASRRRSTSFRPPRTRTGACPAARGGGYQGSKKFNF